MNLFRLELSIPGKDLSLRGRNSDGHASGQPDLAVNLSGQGCSGTEFGKLFKSRDTVSFEAFECRLRGGVAEFYLSDSFISEKLRETAEKRTAPGDFLFGKLSEFPKTPASMDSKKDFYLFYALERANALKRGSTDCGGVFGKNRPARVLSEIIFSGLSGFYVLNSGNNDSASFEFSVKSANFSRLAAELFYLAERMADGKLPPCLASCTEKYIRESIYVEEMPYEA